jgi:hypothetical protein
MKYKMYNKKYKVPALIQNMQQSKLIKGKFTCRLSTGNGKNTALLDELLIAD